MVASRELEPYILISAE
ncbi:hypothetical protein EYF80_067872 [Liparis tanakae]|uniref:Uncharacterized protein n=1 Tax=Liparis tanakae TaxID=230148 RepID=A0A4Z2DZQ9_9TELE|nr:hypothetical protein EYF80_067872 [Liparis tanakae]